jgi:hypothetical protein
MPARCVRVRRKSRATECRRSLFGADRPHGRRAELANRREQHVARQGIGRSHRSPTRSLSPTSWLRDVIATATSSFGDNLPTPREQAIKKAAPVSDLPPPTQSESTLGVDPPTPWWKRKLWKLPTWAWIVVAVFVVGSIASAGGSDPEDADDAVDVTSPSTSDTEVTAAEVAEVGLADTIPVPATPPSEPTATTPATTQPPATDPPTTTVAPTTTTTTTTLPPTTTTPAPESNLTPSQQNAVRSAESYLDFMSFSRQGLIDQLSSEYGEQFPVEDATVAVDSLNADWNAQAAESAQSYLDMSGFSCQGLIDQLASEYGSQFTVEQATYGATQAGIC